MALVAPALLMVPALPLFVGSVPSAMPIGAFLGGMLGVGYSGVTPVLTTSLFAPHVRARAIGLVYHVGALLAAFIPTLIPWIVSSTGMALKDVVMIVVGGGLIVMSAAVLVLRTMITVPAAETLSSASESETETPSASSPVSAPSGSSAAARELHPVAVAIVDREVAKSTQRRAILG
jgi:SHS family lactate transporter-like MFS transporter